MVRSVQRRRRASTPPAAVPLTADDDSVDAIRCVNPSPAKPPQHPEDTVDRLAITAASSPGGRPPDSDHDGESADCDSMTRLAAQSLARTPSPPRMPKRTLRRAMSTSLLNLPTFFNPRASQAGAMATRPETPFEPSFGRGAATSRTPAGTLHAVMSSSPIKGTSTDRKRTKRGAKKTRTTPHRDQIRAALTKRTFGLATASKLMSAAKAAVSEAVTAVKERKKVGRKRPRYSEASARSADAKEEEALAAAVVAAEAITSTSSPTVQKTPRAAPASSSARLRSSKSLKSSSSPHTVGLSSHRKRSRRFAPSCASLAASTGARPRFEAAGDAYLSSSVLNRKRPIPKSEECRALTESLRGVYRSPARLHEDNGDWIDEPDFALALDEGIESSSSAFLPFSTPPFGTARPLFARSLAPSPASTRRGRQGHGRAGPSAESKWSTEPALLSGSQKSSVLNHLEGGETLAATPVAACLRRRPRKSASSPDSLWTAYRAVELELDRDVDDSARGEDSRNDLSTLRPGTQEQARTRRAEFGRANQVVETYQSAAVPAALTGLSGAVSTSPISMPPGLYPSGTASFLSLSTVNRGGRPFRPLPPLPPGSVLASSGPLTATYVPTLPLKVKSRTRSSTTESASTSTATASSSSPDRQQADSSRDVDSDDLASARVVDARRLSLEPVLTGSLMALRRSSTSTGGTATAPVSPILPAGDSPSGYQAFSLSPERLSFAHLLPTEGDAASALRSESDSTDSLTPKPTSTCRIPDSSPMSPFKVDFGHPPASDPTVFEEVQRIAGSGAREESHVPTTSVAFLKSADFPLGNEADCAVIRQAARYVFPALQSSLQAEQPSWSATRRISTVDEDRPDLRRTVRPGRDSTRHGSLQIYQDDEGSPNLARPDVPAEGLAVDDHAGVLVERGEATALRRKGAVVHRPAAAGRGHSPSPNKEN